MMWFWILAAMMILLGLWFVIPPLLSKKESDTQDHDALNVAIYKQKLADLDNNEDKLSAEELAQAKQEIEQSLLQDVDSTQTVTTPINARTQRMVAAIVAVIIPLFTVLFYWQLAPQQLEQVIAYEPGQTDIKKKLPNVMEMVAKLEQKLKQKPEDPRGWSLLGRSYFVMGRYSEAANAYAQANTLSGDNADTLADYAEALAMSLNGKLQGKPAELIQRALAKQPQHPKSLWLAGTTAYQDKAYQKAIDHWQLLYELHSDKQSQGAQTLQKQIAQARSQLGHPPSLAMKPATPKPVAKISVQVSVNLDASLQAKASPNDIVFIFARADQGPPMPLAIVRKQVKDLPVTVKLDDTMAMMPSMKISSFDKIRVGARVSKSGNAKAQPGDLQGITAAISTAKSQHVKVKISEEVR